MTIFLIALVVGCVTAALTCLALARAAAREDAPNALETEMRTMLEVIAIQRNDLARRDRDGQQAEVTPLREDMAYDADTAFHDAWILPAQETIDYIDRELGIVPTRLEPDPELLISASRAAHEILIAEERAIETGAPPPQPGAIIGGWRMDRDGSWTQVATSRPTRPPEGRVWTQVGSDNYEVRSWDGSIVREVRG